MSKNIDKKYTKQMAEGIATKVTVVILLLTMIIFSVHQLNHKENNSIVHVDINKESLPSRVNLDMKYRVHVEEDSDGIFDTEVVYVDGEEIYGELYTKIFYIEESSEDVETQETTEISKNNTKKIKGVSYTSSANIQDVQVDASDDIIDNNSDTDNSTPIDLEDMFQHSHNHDEDSDKYDTMLPVIESFGNYTYIVASELGSMHGYCAKLKPYEYTVFFDKFDNILAPIMWSVAYIDDVFVENENGELVLNYESEEILKFKEVGDTNGYVGDIKVHAYVYGMYNGKPTCILAKLLD